MSYLVNDFIINPVLRQARRFSRSSTQPQDQVRVPSPPPANEGTHENAIEDIAERLGSLGGSGGGIGAGEEPEQCTSISDAPLTSSPIEEDGGLENELEAMGGASLPASSGNPQPAPLRVGSLRSNFGQPDHDVSDNPSYGIPNRFRGSSSASTTHNAGEYIVANGGMSPAEGPSRRSTLEGAAVNIHGNQSSGSLPEDDGMGDLRQQIRFIQSRDLSSEEKARRMHQLLTRKYAEAHELSNAQNQPLLPAPSTMISQERPTTPGSLSSFLWQMNGSPETAAVEGNHTYRLSPEDLKRTYAPPDPPETDEDGDVGIKDDIPILGCRHYKRNVKLQCSACDKWYTCRLCHDAVEDHILNRKETKNMLCMICGCAQRAGEFCVECGERTAWYYCAVCKLWDNDSNKSIYHCNDCGICRKGRGLGKDFFHCKTCGTCMSMSVEHSHKCIERVSDCDCPICGEYMFTSPSPVVFMLCGHGIHKACYDAHMKSSYKCPICSKSTVNMETQFRNLDRAIDSQPMPPQFQDTKAMVSCNDCYAKSAVKYHWLGLKCAICDSYNTAQLSILSDPAVEVPTIEGRDSDSASPPVPTHGEAFSSSLILPNATLHRRHSTHFHGPTLAAPSHPFSPYPRPQRMGRSVSPVAGLGSFDNPAVAQNVETDDSADEEDMDFWGRDEPRSVTSAEHVDDEMEEDESDCDDDEDSTMEDDGEDDGDDADEFELFGHR